MTKAWPENNEVVTFSELVDSARKALEFAYKLNRKNPDSTIPWDGYDIGEHMKASSLTPDEAFSRTQLDFMLRDKGRDALGIILGIFAQTCMEQGRRLTLKRLKPSANALQSSIDTLKSVQDDLTGHFTEGETEARISSSDCDF